MFTFYPTLAAMLICLLWPIACNWLDGRRRDGIVKAVLVMVPFAGLLLIGSGLSLLAVWEDPFARVSGETRASATHGGLKVGLAVLIFRFWPFVLLALGAFGAIAPLIALKRRFQW